MRKRRSNRITPQDAAQAAQHPLVDVSDFDNAAQMFLRDLKLRNRAQDTLVYYRRELQYFRDMLERQHIETDPTKITTAHIKENVILYMMEGLGAQATSINARLRAIRAFFNYLEAEGAVVRNPWRGCQLLRQKRSFIHTFSRDEFHKILRQCDHATFTGLRDYTIMLLMIETGVRLRELCDINVQDIAWRDNYIRIDGKNGQYRNVPFQSTMKRQLRKYVQVRGRVEADRLFVTIDNTPLSRRQVEHRVAMYGRRAGIDKVRCSPHTFRHTFAKMYIMNGGRAFDLQEILGHSSLEMVRIYVRLFSTEVYEEHKKYSPVESLL